MKISLLGTTTYPTPPNSYGGEIFIYDLALSLHNLGHEVILYAVKNDNIEYPFKLNQLRNTRGIADWVAEYQAWEIYKKDILNSDVILDCSHGKNISQQLHNFGIKKEVANYLIGNFWARPFPSYNVIVNSAKQLDMGIKGQCGFEGTVWGNEHRFSGTIPKTSKFAHLGVNTDFYKFEENKEDYFLWLARFHPTKGPDVAIKLAKETGINLIMAGDMDSHPEHRICGNMCLEMMKGYDNIKYVPLPRDETHQRVKMELMRHAKAYLFPVQFHESFGLTTVEALSCGTPVIASNMGALPEIIKHGETGFISEHNNYEKMKSFINSIDEIKPKDCRKDVENRFSREKMAERFEKILVDLHGGEQW